MKKQPYSKHPRVKRQRFVLRSSGIGESVGSFVLRKQPRAGRIAQSTNRLWSTAAFPGRPERARFAVSGVQGDVKPAATRHYSQE